MIILKFMGDVVDEINRNTRYPRKQIEEILNEFTTTVGNYLIDGEDVRLCKFGTFKNKVWHGRTIANIATGETYITKDKNRISFDASKELKDAVN